MQHYACARPASTAPPLHSTRFRASFATGSLSSSLTVGVFLASSAGVPTPTLRLFSWGLGRLTLRISKRPRQWQPRRLTRDWSIWPRQRSSTWSVRRAGDPRLSAVRADRSGGRAVYYPGPGWCRHLWVIPLRSAVRLGICTRCSCYCQVSRAPGPQGLRPLCSLSSSCGLRGGHLVSSS